LIGFSFLPQKATREASIDQDSLSKLFSVQPEAFLASADYSADDGSGDDL